MQTLAGIRVLDLSQMWAAPGAAMYLADHGADVIKVEPLAGDEGRRTLTRPPVAGGESRAFLALNRNKRGIALDIRHPRGREVVRALVPRVDVLIHNFRPGVAERLGYDYPTLRDLNGRLVYAWITAYGAEGPFALRPGYDMLFQGLSGILARRRRPDGTPLGSGVWVADCSAPMELAYGIALALLARERTGQGQLVTTSLLHAALAMQLPDLVRVERDEPAEAGSDYSAQAMYAPYRCRDGRFLILVVVQDEQWRRLCGAIGRPDLADDGRYATPLGRARESAELARVLDGAFGTRDREAWLAALAEADVPSAPILEPDEALDYPQAQANDMLAVTTHPAAGRTVMVSQPVRLHGAAPAAVRPAPLLGEHTEEVLRELGYSPDTIRDLEAQCVIRCRPGLGP
ncbi:MAG: CoA transferase [Candidatus Rokubacteria bacterium]|nr:CoA transferase [Candidatus Rokubacteria bacterium]MBI2526018.1 CoA transferase [Candidatus Rokubacteria bacterium]